MGHLHVGKTSLALDWHTHTDIKYLDEIENGQQSSGKCDIIKSFCELHPQKKLLYNFITISNFSLNILNRSKLYRFLTGTIGLY